MKVYLTPPRHLSQGIQRVARALATFLPSGASVVSEPQDADVAILHVIGLGSLDGWAAEWVASGKPRGIVQYCLTTTENGGDPAFWHPLWAGSKAVWSYYDLLKHLGIDGADWFYHAPMGVDPSLFTLAPAADRPYTVLTSGYIAETEGVTESAEATRRLGRLQFHLGPHLGLGHHVHHATGVSDAELAHLYRACQYVAGLRRIEGFEMPAIEGLLCGARPVMFDAPTYTHWFGDHAVYVPEGSHDEVVDALMDVFSRTPAPVTNEERVRAVLRFSWDRLCTEFWGRFL